MIPTTLFALLLLSATNAQEQNKTVEDNSTDISYAQSFTSGNVCRFDSNGNFIGGQPGCYNVPCTDSFHITNEIGDGLNFTFPGTAIYLNALTFSFTSVVTISIDGGEPTELDTYRPDGRIGCATLFSKTGLGAGNHTISVTLKGISPQLPSNETKNARPAFMLDQFIYTFDNSTGSDSNPPPGGALSNASYQQLWLVAGLAFLAAFFAV